MKSTEKKINLKSKIKNDVWKFRFLDFLLPVGNGATLELTQGIKLEYIRISCTLRDRLKCMEYKWH